MLRSLIIPKRKRRHKLQQRAGESMAPSPKSLFPTDPMGSTLPFDELQELALVSPEKNIDRKMSLDSQSSMLAAPVEKFLNNFRRNGSEIISSAYL
jgi:hypothetical protein